MTISNRIEGFIRLTSPMHCATIDSGEASGNKNATPTHKQKINVGTTQQFYPYFPANDLRGRLRRKAANLVLKSITQKGKVSVDLYAALNAGAINASPESDLSVEEALRARDNVYMGLFGGGTRLLRSRYCTNDLIPVTRGTVDVAIVPEWVGNEAGLPENNYGPLTGYHLLDTRTSFRIDDVSRVMNVNEINQFVENALQSVAQKQTQTLNARATRKESKSAAAAAKEAGQKGVEVTIKTDTANMFAVESVIRGTAMHCLIDLSDDVSDIHVGLMLLALRDLVREQALGGWIRAGFGRYTAHLKLTRNGQAYRLFRDSQNAADAQLTDEIEAAFCAPARAAIDQLTASQMMEFFTPQKAADDEPKRGKRATSVEA